MAGVYIPGMQMPTNKDTMEPTAVWVYPNGYAVVFQDRGNMTQYTQAIPVSDHGDLIERDKLRQTMFIGEQCLYSWDEVEDAIDFAPTVIPADRKEGEA